MEETRLQIQGLAVNILTNQSLTANNGWSSSLRVGKPACYKMLKKGLGLGHILLSNLG
jgi:hypothetical protein